MNLNLEIMKQIIIKVKLQKGYHLRDIIEEDSSDLGRFHNVTDYEILQSRKTIKAKALRNKGTDKWYRWHTNVETWLPDDIFLCYTDDATVKHFSGILPSDAELIDIEILLP
jgi:hypothetical protein